MAERRHSPPGATLPRASFLNRENIQRISRLFMGRVAAVILAAACLCASQAFAQSTFGTLVGTVKDPSGSVVAGCVITATNTGTAAQRSSVTDKDGGYVLVNMEPG